MIGNWLRVLSRKTRAEMGGLTAQAANWTSSITADIKLPHRGLSLNFQERLHRQREDMHGPGEEHEEEDEREQQDKRNDKQREPSPNLLGSSPIKTQTPIVTPALTTEDVVTQALEWGENMAFIDESSDTQSDMGVGEAQVRKLPKGKRKGRGARSVVKRDTHPGSRNRDKGESG
ncbi:potassium channel subfamily K member 4-like [Spea bombifrons]|uniref:potassium channel subfamily K member 4-like n=1 Tax=Spea bombifrons TaxID=233779 RepID=UPI0023493C5C|nr:potassium channel subfamily K member 4-like [Spea bombifrons]